MFHTYYISLEFQLFMIGLAFLMIIWRYPKSQKVLMSIITSLSIASAAILTYRNNLNGILVVTPEERRLLTHQTYFQNYMTAIEPNAGPYFIGLSLGLLYIPMKNIQILVKMRYKLAFYLWHVVPIFAVLSMLSTQLFYEYDFEKPSLWMAVYAMFTQNIWGFMAASAALLFCLKKTSFITSMFNLPVFLPIYRLTYTTYICHITVLYVIAGASKGASNIGTIPLVMNSEFFFIKRNLNSFLSFCLLTFFPAFIYHLLLHLFPLHCVYPYVSYWISHNRCVKWTIFKIRWVLSFVRCAYFCTYQFLIFLGKKNSRYTQHLELVT